MSSFFATIKAEWLKFRTVRSTLVGVLLTFVFTIGLGALVTSLVRNRWNDPQARFHRSVFDPTTTSLGGVFFAQFAVGVIGILFITSEYSSGAIKTTLTAVPSRLRLVLAKLAVLKLSMLVVTEVAVFVAFLIGQAIYRGVVPTASLANATTFRQVFLTGVYLIIASVLGLGIGLILRQSAASISTFTTLMLILPVIVALLPTSIQNDVAKYEPLSLGQSMRAATVAPYSFTPWVATVIFSLYAVVVLGVGIALFERRDA